MVFISGDTFGKERRGELSELNRGQVCGYLKSYAQNLAARLILKDGQLSQRLLTDDDTLIPHLVEPIYNGALLREYETTHRDGIFTNSTNLRALRSGCLLKTEGTRYKFLHKSLIEFLAARELFDGLRGEYDLYLRNAAGEEAQSGLNRQLIKDKGVISNLVERVNTNERFKNFLFEIIESSKYISGLGVMAANAITVLNKAMVNFSGFDFRDIQIPGADLSYALCEGTDFRSADLSDVSFNGACLEDARWNGANCSNISFGEQAYLQHPNRISNIQNRVNAVSFYQSKEASYWISGCADACVYQWDSETHKLFRTYNHFDYTIFWIKVNESSITSVAVENLRHLLIAGTGHVIRNDIWLWSLQTGHLLRKLKGHSYEVHSLVISNLGDLLASRSTHEYNRILLWDLPDGTLKQQLLNLPRSDFVISGNMWFSPVGDLFAAIIAGKIQLWKLPSGEKGPLFGKNILSINFSSDGSRLISTADGVGKFHCYLWIVSDTTVEPILLSDGWSDAFHFSSVIPPKNN